jgi:hypothetical protein
MQQKQSHNPGTASGEVWTTYQLYRAQRAARKAARSGVVSQFPIIRQSRCDPISVLLSYARILPCILNRASANIPWLPAKLRFAVLLRFIVFIHLLAAEFCCERA